MERKFLGLEEIELIVAMMEQSHLSRELDKAMHGQTSSFSPAEAYQFFPILESFLASLCSLWTLFCDSMVPVCHIHSTRSPADHDHTTNQFKFRVVKSFKLI